MCVSPCASRTGLRRRRAAASSWPRKGSWPRCSDHHGSAWTNTTSSVAPVSSARSTAEESQRPLAASRQRASASFSASTPTLFSLPVTLSEALEEERVGAGRAAALEVAHVEREGEAIFGVDLAQERFE